VVNNSRLADITRLGQSVWIDWLSRDLLLSGGLQKLIAEHAVSGVTTNPTILEHAISSGDAYDEQIRGLLAPGIAAEDVFEHLAATDVRLAAEQLSSIWYRTGGLDGFVSWEVAPRLAGNAKATVAEVRRLYDHVPLPNVLIKIPATEAGVSAVEEATALGHSINVTLIFSLERYAAVVEAYLRGLHRAAEAGRDLAAIYSVASFFISRLDVAADRLLSEIGSLDALSMRGHLGIASAKVAYRHFHEAFSGARWDELKRYGARPQRLLWASTSMKNPDLRDVRYVENLIGPGTITTLPEATLLAFEDHGHVESTLTEHVEIAWRTLSELAALGIDLEALTDELERGGIDQFQASHAAVIDRIRSTRFARAA
jgi:transaldolase